MLDGSGFIAAFVAGIVFRFAVGRDPADQQRRRLRSRHDLLGAGRRRVEA